MFLVIDLEATCWEKDAPAQPSEIIEIGCALVSAKQVVFNESWFVKPRINPTLSKFCCQLTTISQSDIDNAPFYDEALQNFTNKVQEICSSKINSLPFISWGNYDRKQFLSECARQQISYPFGKHINLKKAFLRRHRLQAASLSTALEMHAIKPQGTLHRAKDDAFNTAQLFVKIFNGELPN